MSCDTGQGSFLSMDFEKVLCTDSGSDFNNASAMLLTTAEKIENITLELRVRSFGAWTVTTEIFDSPRVDDRCGAFRRKRAACDRDHDAWTAEIEWPTAKATPDETSLNNYDLTLLVGAYGTIRRTQPDGSYYEGKGWITSATALPEANATDEMTGELSVQWEGGWDPVGERHTPYYKEPTS